ncbi:hypothetical protein COU78_05140 [Candidatus Peregrinibacteria bacterium CG10_big_fil_rev_8_21_14_0_10_49_24]|nr:MAG: hypothetical protein COV83_01510 [Candidatus Peregrinibacteria bacterium CG11_big_fil_rev_8_21_14_0_20_49_14]PIR50730.1 MAG: hypothetical protein COU78_05140 [Candidatus Peregrinibacteria bacterium CG10_big_fil_rev_8_21_14_0_10_49_24]PJA68225.1 MAG: hypothetical protein CO157_00670 [Candidatus Peregrinibacteria bacterium CG_4_9_14_3_um_filter_49_12]
MKRSLALAIGIQVIIMIAVLVPPLLVKNTGTRVYLETRRVDPRSLFRGDYVILDYPVGDQVSEDLRDMARENNALIYVTVTTDRPATFVSAGFEKPTLQEGEACLSARGEWGSVVFPQISQYFVPEGEGKEIEQNLNSMVAEVATTTRCNAVTVSLQSL